MEKMFLTNGGNLLRFHPSSNKFYFQKPNGEFIREVSNSEAEYLCQNCLEVEVKNPHEHPEFLPKWHFIKSVCVIADYTNWKYATCNNGGNYSFHTYHDWYVAKYPDGSWKVAFVERYSTSAEFSFDELAGSFQSDLSDVNLVNTDMRGFQNYSTQTQSGLMENEVLEKIGILADFSDLWKETYEYIPSRWEDEDESYSRPALNFSEKKDIITRLKELGVEKQSTSKPPRGNRGGKGGGRR